MPPLRSAMTHHPHVHMIVPGGGIALDGYGGLAQPSTIGARSKHSAFFRLHASWRAGEARASVALDCLLYGESEVAVGGCRDRSRLVVGHWIDDSTARPTLAGYPQ
jgi:hypothetical protein